MGVTLPFSFVAVGENGLKHIRGLPPNMPFWTHRLDFPVRCVSWLFLSFVIEGCRGGFAIALRYF